MAERMEIGCFYNLTVIDLAHGAVVLDGGVDAHGAELDLLLPSHLAPNDVAVGDVLELFIYADGDGKPQATTLVPAGVLGECVCLECVAVTSAGAFLAWGIPKDLYVPPIEQVAPMKVGRHYVVAICVDKKGERLIASTDLNRHFDYDVSKVKPGDEVEVLVYGHVDAGVQVVVDRRHRGLIHRSTLHRELLVGTTHQGFVHKVREDNRLDIELTRHGAEGAKDAADVLLAALRDAGGTLPLHDKSDPSEVERTLGMSKKAFKRAVGRLYKARRVVIGENSISLVVRTEDSC